MGHSPTVATGGKALPNIKIAVCMKNEGICLETFLVSALYQCSPKSRMTLMLCFAQSSEMLVCKAHDL